MSNYDYLKRMADQAAAQNQKAFNRDAYNAAPPPVRNLMDTIANKKS